MKRFVLIDGNAILHRAYHALPPLTSPDGNLVNAVYGFTSMLLKLFTDLKPDYLAVAFDRPKPTFRKELYKEYQAKRPKMDEELVGQIEKVHEVLAAFGIPIYEKDGYEADDVLATLSREALNPKSKILNKSKIQNSNNQKIDQVIIVTGDKDILQVVQDDKVLVYMPTKGLSEAKLYGEKEVRERMGVAPDKVPDLKALAGDPSDNYPGVPGVGPKTAVQVLTTFGSLEKLYEAIKKKDKRLLAFSQSVVEKLKKGLEDAKLSQKLATLQADVPLKADLGLARLESLDKPQARQILEELNFRSLLKRLQTRSEVTKSAGAPESEQQKLF